VNNIRLEKYRKICFTTIITNESRVGLGGWGDVIKEARGELQEVEKEKRGEAPALSHFPSSPTRPFSPGNLCEGESHRRKTTVLHPALV